MLIPSLLALATILVPPLFSEEKRPQQQTHILIILGPPGAGKGTQAALIQETLQIPHISTGDILRQNIKSRTDLGKKAQDYMDQGKLVPDELILDMLLSRINDEDCQKGYILDGFPRTLAQAKAYHERLDQSAKVLAINLDISHEEILDRLTKRMICKNCHAPFHLTYCPPKKELICDHCSGPLIQRTDDTETVVRKRLEVYREQTAPLISFYTKLERLETIQCNQRKEKVTKEILSVIRQTYL
jgi:adenylate kinase